MKVKVLRSTTTEKHYHINSASFYEPLDYYRGLLEEYDYVMIEHVCKDSGDMKRSDLIYTHTFLNNLIEFVTPNAEGLFIRYK